MPWANRVRGDALSADSVGLLGPYQTGCLPHSGHMLRVPHMLLRIHPRMGSNRVVTEVRVTNTQNKESYIILKILRAVKVPRRKVDREQTSSNKLRGSGCSVLCGGGVAVVLWPTFKVRTACLQLWGLSIGSDF